MHYNYKPKSTWVDMHVCESVLLTKAVLIGSLSQMCPFHNIAFYKIPGIAHFCKGSSMNIINERLVRALLLSVPPGMSAVPGACEPDQYLASDPEPDHCP